MSGNNNPNSFDAYNIIGGEQETKQTIPQPANVTADNSGMQPPQQPPQQQHQPQQAPQQPQYQPQQPPPTQQPQYQPQQQYQQQPNYQPQGQPAYTTPQYPDRQYSGKKGGKGSAVFFWIMWILIGGFTILLNLTIVSDVKSYVSLAATVAVLLLLFIIRKKLYKSVIAHLFIWILSIVVLVVIFSVGVQKAGGDNLITASFNVSKSIEFNNGEAKITNEGFARTVDLNTAEPVEKTNVFKPEDSTMYFVIILDYLPAGCEINSVWYYNEEVVLNPEPVKIDQEIKGRYFLAPPLTHDPQQKLPVGKYSIELTGTKDGRKLFSIKDFCEVK